MPTIVKNCWGNNVRQDYWICQWLEEIVLGANLLFARIESINHLCYNIPITFRFWGMGVQIFNIVMDLSGGLLVHMFENKIANGEQLFNASRKSSILFLRRSDIKDNQQKYETAIYRYIIKIWKPVFKIIKIYLHKEKR